MHANKTVLRNSFPDVAIDQSFDGGSDESHQFSSNIVGYPIWIINVLHLCFVSQINPHVDALRVAGTERPKCIIG